MVCLYAVASLEFIRGIVVSVVRLVVIDVCRCVIMMLVSV